MLCVKSEKYAFWVTLRLLGSLWQGKAELHILAHGSLALDSAVVRKISKCHFFQDIKNFLHGVTRMGLKPHQNFFQKFFSTNMVARGVQSFCILEGATDLLIEQ